MIYLGVLPIIILIVGTYAFTAYELGKERGHELNMFIFIYIFPVFLFFKGIELLGYTLLYTGNFLVKISKIQ